eukprot:1536720-Rhodomonas_salina.2
MHGTELMWYCDAHSTELSGSTSCTVLSLACGTERCSVLMHGTEPSTCVRARAGGRAARPGTLLP